MKTTVLGTGDAADLVIEFLDGDGNSTARLTLRDLAGKIGPSLLERAGASRDRADAADGHSHHTAPTTAVSEQIDEFATHVAIRNGDWTDPGTWADGTVPGEGAIVHIPADVAVSYGANAGEAHIFYIHVDGALSLSSQDGLSRLTVDTIFTTKGSSFEADATSGNLLDIAITPFDANRIDGLTDHRAYWANGISEGKDGNGVLGRYEWDPAQVSLGLVTEGRVKIIGQDKVSHLELDASAGNGANSIRLDLSGLDLPQGASNAEILDAVGWAVGDRIAVGSSEFGSAEQFSRWTEERQVTDVRIESGDLVVRLDRALSHEHQVKQVDLEFDGTPDMKIAPSVANLTKNLQIRSDATTTTNESGTVWDVNSNLPTNLVTQQGHTMFMHSTDVQIENATFAGLGRSDKSRSLDDKIRVEDREAGLVRPVGDADLVDVTNMRGRYALHLHESGFEDTGDKDTSDAFDYGGAHVSNNLVWGGPGWGIAHHGGLATITDNAVYEMFGAGIVSETGDEQGAWANNLAMVSDQDGGDTWNAGNGRVPRTEDRFVFNQDFGRSGTGYWLESRMIEVTGNKAQSFSSTGFFIDGSGGSSRMIAIDDLPDWLQPYGDALDRAGGLDGMVHARDIPLMKFEDNTTIGAHTGLWFEDGVQSRIPLASFGRPEREGGAVEHDLRSLIEGHVSSEVERSGSFIVNASQITVDSPIVSGTHPAENHVGQAFGGGAYRESTEITIYNGFLEDWRKGEPVGNDQNRLYSFDFFQTNFTGVRDQNVVKVTTDATGFETGLDKALGETENIVSQTGQNAPGSTNGLDREFFAGAPFTYDLDGDTATPDRFTTILGTKSDQVAYTPRNDYQAQWSPEILNKIRVTDETYVFDTATVNADNADAGRYVTGIWGVKIDSIGATYAPFADQQEEGVDIAGVGEELAMALTVSDIEFLIERDGLVEIGGDRFLIMEELFSDRVTTDLQAVHYAIKLNGTHWNQFAPTSSFDSVEFGLAKDAVGEVSFTLADRTYTEHETFVGGGGNDMIFGQFGNDDIRGGAGDDFLHGGEGVDTVRGESGNDTLVASGGDDLLGGGDGSDVVIFKGRAADYSVTAGGNGVIWVTKLGDSGQTDKLHSIETLVFDDLSVSVADDREIMSVLGYEYPNPDPEDQPKAPKEDPPSPIAEPPQEPGLGPENGPRNDTLRGGMDDDSLSGGAGADNIYGNEGDDTLEGGADKDTLRGDDGDDHLSGGHADDLIYGGAG
ncbi:MAG: calcium-binding protein, partial [Pseudomonadota bacterium]